MSLTQTSCDKKESPINFKIVEIFLKRELRGCIIISDSIIQARKKSLYI